MEGSPTVTATLGREAITNLDSIKKQRHYFANKGQASQSSGFSRSHVWMWELDHKESWAPKNWCLWSVMLEKTLESPMDCSTPDLPVYHQLLEFTQICVHWISDAIQPSHLLSSPSPAFNFPSIRVFSNESALRIRWPKYWSFSFNISPSNEHSGLISFRMDWLVLLAVQGLSRVFSNTTIQKHQFFGAQLSL